ncbi:MAG: ATP-binding protein [Nitrospira sp.]|nr:ATP-binding protein [Nitrospira sp.]
MSIRPANPASDSFPTTEFLDQLTRFSIDLGAMTDLGPLSRRAIQELCRVGGATQGALYLLDREHEHYRRAAATDSSTALRFPESIALDHPIPHRLASPQAEVAPHHSPTSGGSFALESSDEPTLVAMGMALALPHISRGQLIAFSLLDSAQPRGHEASSVRALLAVLTQTATNAVDRLMLYEDLHRSHLLMKRTDRLKSLETIAGGFAHEIRNPLTSIKTFIQLAPERKDDPDFIRDFSRIVLDDVYRIERLIDEILDYARYMEPKLTEEDINDIVSSCLYFIEVKADTKGIKIEKELASNLPRVMLDRQQVKQVFLNLFLNALDAMGTEGGFLRVRTKLLNRPGGRVWVQVETEDTGEGIPEGNLEHIFDPFFTTKHESGEHEGTGLGLTIVHQIIQEHRGEIQVRSVPGQGTTFLVNLPALSS